MDNKKAIRIQFPIEGYTRVEYEIKNISNSYNTSYLLVMPEFLKDNEQNYYLIHGVHLVPIDRFFAENTISDFSKYFNGNYPNPKGDIILNKRLDELYKIINSFEFE